MAEETKAKKPGLFARIGKWFRELKSECRKIVWPTREQTTNNTRSHHRHFHLGA